MRNFFLAFFGITMVISLLSAVACLYIGIWDVLPGTLIVRILLTSLLTAIVSLACGLIVHQDEDEDTDDSKDEDEPEPASSPGDNS